MHDEVRSLLTALHDLRVRVQAKAQTYSMEPLTIDQLYSAIAMVSRDPDGITLATDPKAQPVYAGLVRLADWIERGFADEIHALRALMGTGMRQLMVLTLFLHPDLSDKLLADP
jgi:hypothetical protein